jgi:uncharacterized protein (DUF488 family)
MTTGPEESLRLFTIGHSNRSWEDFLSLLREFSINTIADIRRYPSSRKFPHFNRKALRTLLDAEGIGYVWFEALGGRRHAAPNEDSPNAGLRSIGFRNYADYMAADDFRAAVRQLLSTAASSRTAVMCAEKFYWKCHRRLLCDYLAAQAVEVEHIIDPCKSRQHKLTPGAVITPEAAVIYPASTPHETQLQDLFDP